jgi:hypothetical protein
MEALTYMENHDAILSRYISDTKKDYEIGTVLAADPISAIRLVEFLEPVNEACATAYRLDTRPFASANGNLRTCSQTGSAEIRVMTFASQMARGARHG